VFFFFGHRELLRLSKQLPKIPFSAMPLENARPNKAGAAIINGRYFSAFALTQGVFEKMFDLLAEK